MAESLETEQQRTVAFLALVRSEMTRMELIEGTEPILDVLERGIPSLVSVEECYEVREKLAGALSAAAFKTLMKKWKETAV